MTVKNIFYIPLILLLLTACTMTPEIKTEKMEESEETVTMKTESNETILIALTGDVMLGRLVNEQISLTNYSYPWGDLLPLLKNTDFNIINLETTLTTSEKIVPKVFNFKADPDKVQTLVKGKIDIVSLANNHILDFAEGGLKETIKVLDEAGIKHVGAGENIDKAKVPNIIKKKNITIGIIGYTDNEPEWEAEEDKSGTNYVEIGNDKQLKDIEKEIKNLKEKVDLLIFTIHWGPNMRERPNKEFQNFAHQIIDAGVDIFHGHSAHLFQGIEVYKNKIIFYDTGDFVDDYAVDSRLRNDRSFLYLVEVDKKGIKKVELVPTLISRMQVNKAAGEDYQWSVERIKELSKELGTEVEEKEGKVLVGI